MNRTEQQARKMATQQGFIAALDQSGGSTPKALNLYGLKNDAWSNDEQMFALVHQMRTRIITTPAFNGDRILGAILFRVMQPVGFFPVLQVRAPALDRPLHGAGRDRFAV